MFKVLIVDDESMARDGLHSFDWSRQGFQVIGSVSNGKRALEIMEKTPVDLVITEIKMPIMDGLELSYAINDRYPHCKIIIRSGDKEFEYAKSAIKAGVCEYLLKPIDTSEMENILEKLKIQLDKEKTANHMLHSMENLLKQSLPIAINIFWKELTNGTLDDIEIVEKMNLLGISFQSSYFACAIFNIETASASKPKTTTKQGYPDSLIDKLEQYLNVHHLGYFFINEKNNLVFILNFSNSHPSESPYDSLLKIINDIEKTICRSYGALDPPKTFAGVGNIYPNIYQVSLSYGQAEESLKRRFFDDEVNIIYSWEEEAVYMQAPVQYPYERENDLIKSIFECDKVKAFEDLKAFFNELNTGIKYLEPSLIKNMILELFLVLERKLRKYEISIESFLMEGPSQIAYCSEATIKEVTSKSLLKVNFLMLLLYIEEQKTFRDLKESVENLIEKTILALLNKKESVKTTSHAAIQQTITYIQNHFHEKITLSHVAQKAYLNPCYFSIQFKKETGMNFVDFLKETRINKAKELLKRIDLKVSEVAETVGFQNKQYFSDAFKRHTGQTPLEYRQQLISITSVDCASRERQRLPLPPA